MRLSLIPLAAAMLTLACAPAASAYKIAPPGNSAVSEYVENVPGAKGNQPSLTIHAHGGQGNSSAVAPATQQALGGQGADGARAIALAEATAPSGLQGVSTHQKGGATGGRRGHGRHGTGRPASGGAGSGGGGTGSGGTTGSTPVSGSVVSPTSAVLKAVTGSATHGLGALLPAILVVSALGAGLLAALRRRRAT